MIHKACMPVYMNSGKIVADGTGGREIEGSTRGPRGPKNHPVYLAKTALSMKNMFPYHVNESNFVVKKALLLMRFTACKKKEG